MKNWITNKFLGKSLLKGWRSVFALLACLLFAATVSLVMNSSWTEFPIDLRAGAIAGYSIRADRDYEIVDEEATEKLKQEKLGAVLPVFDWDDRASRGLKIVSDKKEFASWLEKGVLLRLLSMPATEPTFFKQWDEVLTLEEAKKRFTSHPTDLRPNLVLNQQETETRKAKVLSEIKEVVIKVQRGESILRSGDRIAPWHVNVLKGIQAKRVKVEAWERWFGIFSFTLFFLGLLYAVGESLPRNFRMNRVDYLFQGILILILLVVERSLLYFSAGIKELLPFDVSLNAFYLVLPVATGAMTVRLLLTPQIALLFSIGFSVLASLLLENNVLYMLYFLSGGLVAAVLVGSVRSRAQLLKSGIQVGLVNAATLLILSFANTTSPSHMTLVNELPTLLVFSFLGGVFSAVLTFLLLPLFESPLFNYLTPIKLLEYGSLNHPLLREMIVRAPGTYHHCHLVGTLAEAACESIGADSLFARVASCFHDIGKMKKAPYYIENQPVGEDRHAHLSPSMSALIIAAHVKEGIELGKEYGLPQKILDIIPQHQGTKLISYFYAKAKEAEQTDLHVVDERHFRYPGPKPQTREAGVILLADTVEASTRSLKEKTAARIEEVVRNMINKNFIDGQLDECQLTLKDLQLIGKSFVRILVGIYHQRIEYPELPRKEESPRPAMPHVDKFTEPSPLQENSLREDQTFPPKTIPRIGTDRKRN